MKKCDRCRWKYPEEYLSQMFVGKGYTKPICAICALEIANELCGVVQTSFQGETAEYMRQLAIEWRKKNPSRKPAVQ